MRTYLKANKLKLNTHRVTLCGEKHGQFILIVAESRTDHRIHQPVKYIKVDKDVTRPGEAKGHSLFSL